MPDEWEEFVNGVARRVSRGDRKVLDTAIKATLRSLGSHLGGIPPSLDAVIPRALATHLEAGDTQPRVGPAALYLLISNELGLRVGMALDVAQSTVAELTHILPEPARRQLRLLLPPAWAVFAQEPPAHARERMAPSP